MESLWSSCADVSLSSLTGTDQHFTCSQTQFDCHEFQSLPNVIATDSRNVHWGQVEPCLSLGSQRIGSNAENFLLSSNPTLASEADDVACSAILSASASHAVQNVAPIPAFVSNASYDGMFSDKFAWFLLVVGAVHVGVTVYIDVAWHAVWHCDFYVPRLSQVASEWTAVAVYCCQHGWLPVSYRWTFLLASITEMLRVKIIDYEGEWVSFCQNFRLKKSAQPSWLIDVSYSIRILAVDSFCHHACIWWTEDTCFMP